MQKSNLNNAGEFLQPDDVTFSVLMRGYGEMNPPSWVLISGLLKMMDKKFSMKPSLGNLPLQHARRFWPSKVHRQLKAYTIKDEHKHKSGHARLAIFCIQATLVLALLCYFAAAASASQ